MLKKKEPAKTEKVDTIIGKGTEFKGNIVSKGALRIDGKAEGEINAGDNLVVGEEGKVHANVKGKSITVAGELHGNVDCSETLEILSTGTLIGDVKVGNLFIDDGATFDGNCEMKQKKEQGTPQKKT